MTGSASRVGEAAADLGHELPVIARRMQRHAQHPEAGVVGDLQAVEIVKCNLATCSFERCDLYNVSASDSSFRGAQFRQSTFSKTISRRSALTKASFDRCNISFADLSGLPPLIIQAGTHEVLLDDAVRLAQQAATADVEVTLDITPRVPHVFQAYHAILDEAVAALDGGGQLLSAHLRNAERVAV